MPGKLLLDTNIAIALLNGNPVVRKSVADADEVQVSVVTLGELHYGAERSSRREVNMKRLEECAAAWSVLGVDAATARMYGQVKRRLKEAGRPIAENDIWLAATALAHDLTLVTRDAHFDAVADLRKESWQ